MKRKIRWCIVLLAISGVDLAADPVEGFWVSVDDKTGKVTAGWEMYVEGNTLYGKMHSLAGFPKGLAAGKCKETYPGFPMEGRVSQMPVIGTPWIFGLTMDEPGQWGHGSIVNPEDGHMYRCKIRFRPADGKRFMSDVLEMRGEIGLGIGRSQFWQKSTFEEASNLW